MCGREKGAFTYNTFKQHISDRHCGQGCRMKQKKISSRVFLNQSDETKQSFPCLKLCFLTVHSRHLMFCNTLAWQALFISTWQTRVHNEDISQFLLPLLCVRTPCAPLVPHPGRTRLIIVRIPSRQWRLFNLVWM